MQRLLLTVILTAGVIFLSFADHLQAQQPKEITNSIGMKLVLIPKGTFMMGSPESEEGRGEDETQHQATNSHDYYLGVTEVTQGQYEKIMGKNPSHFQKPVLRKSDCSMHPVEKVSWEDAVDFCKRLSELLEEKKAGRVYRLPTEAEWEYACRAGSKMAYCFGNDSKSLGDYAWFNANSNAQTHPVGEKKPNAWGLYDMHGNVHEWFLDWYGEYSQDAVADPSGPSNVSTRACRGGAWNSNPFFCRSAYRRKPGLQGLQMFHGFRVALSSSEIPKSPEAGSK